MKAIGIDLGTTNSVAAYVEGKVPKVLQNRQNESLTPSVVSYKAPKKDKEGQILVGLPAVNNAALAPTNTIYSIKRLMGRIYDEPKVQELKDKVSYSIVTPTDAEEEHGVRVLLNKTPYSPVDISAEILKNIKEYAEYRLGETVTHAVITVPAYFEERQRAATRASGEQAGLVVKRIISEPVAAALAFGLEAAQEEARRVLVFDLGGGTFDISIIQMFGETAQVLYHGGDNWLGGDDFDREIVTVIIDYLKDEEEIDLSEDPEFLAKAKSAAQKAKIALGASNEYSIIINPAGQKPTGEWFSVDVTVTREEFEKMILHYVDRCIELSREAMQNQSFTQEDITDILLVGGSTSVPLIQERLQEAFPKISIQNNMKPMECVALGASILAAKLKGIECPECYEDEESKQHTINDESATVCRNCGTSLASAQVIGDEDFYDVTAMDLGIRAVQGDDNLNAFVPIIEKGTSYPLSEPKRQTFYTTADNQNLIKVPVFEGTHTLADQNDQQGIIEWFLPEGLAINTPIEVSFNYDRDRTLEVTLRVMNRGDLIYKVELKRDRPLEVLETSQDEEEDWREDADSIIPAAESFLQYFGAYMKKGTPSTMKQDLEKLRRALNDNNEILGRRASQEIYMAIMGGAGVASQLYMAERIVQGASPSATREIQAAADDLRRSYEAGGDESSLGEKIGLLKAQIAKQMVRMKQEEIGDKMDYEELLRFKQ